MKQYAAVLMVAFTMVTFILTADSAPHHDSNVPLKRHKRQVIPGDGNGNVSVTVRCFTSSVCGGDSVLVESVRECCVGSRTSMAYQLEDGATGTCQQCVVIGWVDGPRFVGVEQAITYELEVNYLKGSQASIINFDVAISEVGLTAGRNDFRFTTFQVDLDRELNDRQVQINFQVDSLALEPNETLSLVLSPRNGQEFTHPNEFLDDTIELVIVDRDDIRVLFTELDYRISTEDVGVLTVTVERRLAIAVPLALRITPFNITHFRQSNIPPPRGLNELLQIDFETEIASNNPSEPERRDFDDSVFEVVFEPGDSPQQDLRFDIPITPDETNEANERFILVLEVADPELAARVDTSERNACVCVIIDDDPIFLSWEFPEYTTSERIETVDMLFNIRLIKDANTTTELVIGVVVITIFKEDTGFPQALGEGEDYDIGGRRGVIIRLIGEEQQFIEIPMELTEDGIFEGTEVFSLTIENLVETARFTNGRYPTTTIFIVDEDRVRIGFVVTEVTVDETSSVALLNVSILEGTTSIPINVSFCTQPDSAEAPDDYTETLTHLVFNSDTRSFLVSVPITDDSLPELTESFQASLKLNEPQVPQITISPDIATVTILDNDGEVTKVNDTVIGDPLLTVPIRVSNLDELGLQENLSLCYEVHGRSDAYFNLVSDTCTSVNAHYIGVESFNVIDQIAVTAVDELGNCKNILIEIENGRCKASVDGSILSVGGGGGRFSSSGVVVREYANRVRISVPNCAGLNLVMWALCMNGTLVVYDSEEEGEVEVEASMIKFVITRGFNLQETSHGIIGQFWNIPVRIDLYPDVVHQDSPDDTFYIVSISHPDSPTRQFPAFYWPRTWELSLTDTGPCLYAGSWQGGSTNEIEEFDDTVIQGVYTDYQVSGPFETEYLYSRFDREQCN